MRTGIISVHVNFEQGGIIDTMRRSLAIHGYPMDYEAGSFLHTEFWFDMTTNRGEEFVNRISDATLGREASVEESLTSGRILKVRLGLLGESFGNMPDYIHDSSTQKIGMITVRIEENGAVYDPHHIPDEDCKYESQTALNGVLDILANGDIHVEDLLLRTCEECDDINLSDHMQLLGRLGLRNYFNEDRLKKAHHLSHYYGSGYYFKELVHAKLDDKESDAIIGFVRDTFPAK